MITKYFRSLTAALSIILILIFSSGKIYSNTNSNPLISQLDFNGSGGQTFYGIFTASAGDVNGDGFDDIMVSEYGYASNTGRVNIYFGGNNMNTVPDVVLTGENPGSAFGTSVSGAGDLNNDGYDDVIVSAILYNSNLGRVYIYFGGPAMNNVADVVMTGTIPNSYFGSAVSIAGDINNDGYDDVVVGNRGVAFLYFGSAAMDSIADVTFTSPLSSSGFSDAVASAGDINNDGYDDVLIADPYAFSVGKAYLYLGGAVMNNVIDQDFTGEGGFANFGFSVAYAGDVNNDGYDDIVIGSQGHNSNRGKAYLYHGGSTVDNIADHTFTGEAALDRFGYAVAGGGDFNNDGYDDLIVSSLDHSNSKGKAYLYYGGAAMNNVADETFTGENINDFFGVSVSFAGDVNNDGYDDLLCGASNYQMGSGEGKAYLYRNNYFTSVLLTAFIEGFYNSSTDLLVSDSVKVYLRNNFAPYTIVDSSAGVLNNIGRTRLFFNGSDAGNYYLVFKHRNSIETWSKAGGEHLAIADTLNFNLSTSSSQAFGNNIKQIDTSPLRYGIYSGDENKDGFVNLSDVVNVYNNSLAFLSGYVQSDMNGDNITDLSDVVITLNNTNLFVGAIIP